MAFVMGQPNMMGNLMKPQTNALKTMQGALSKKPKVRKEVRVPPGKPGRQFGQTAISGILPK